MHNFCSKKLIVFGMSRGYAQCSAQGVDSLKNESSLYTMFCLKKPIVFRMSQGFVQGFAQKS
jgi:hypothetical protein